MVNEVTSCKQPIFFVLGATGSGKSLAAVDIATTLKSSCGYEHVVIINCDVMQFYMDLPIATNKVSLNEMQGISHYFMGFLSPKGVKIRDPTIPYEGCDKKNSEVLEESKEEEIYNIHSYVHDVVEFINKFFQNNSSAAVIVCGGTCYYIQALMFENVLTEEDADDSVALDSNANSSICEEKFEGYDLWKELNKIDPSVAIRYHPNDKRRIVRLLEIYKKTGRLPSEIYGSRPSPCFRFSPMNCFVLWPRVNFEKLKLMLDERVDKMVEKGIVEECLEFAQQHVKADPDTGLARAIGFKEFIPAFEEKNGVTCIKGENELKKSIEQIKINTKRYARQQIQWITNRFLGRFREVFISAQGIDKFISLDVSDTVLEFREKVKKVTRFWIMSENGSIENIIFPLKEPRDKITAVKQEWCEMCGMFVSGGVQMDAHILSKRHRGAIRHAALVKEQLEKYGRIIPRKKPRLS
ncbi:putative tRNA isopentenyltransferase [Trypanosoma theileri]|uniref:Putative tRNA isopentenyltransferase n=1 Tax=Trypanosoma theileri TaxID=67003 RepID=A0A1X0P0W0_9TRYP|nr:putative tRNA isopentenyltransferase [Trypanosoma theileri]ORC90159.1 putative tRNA isopentenyltransferase [Trypanosoma theileri]